MCAVSFVGDHYSDKFKERIPWINTYPVPNTSSNTYIFSQSEITREEFDALKKDVEEMKALLIRAKKYDEENDEPDCEMEEKVALLKKVAEFVGVDLTEVFGNK